MDDKTTLLDKLSDQVDAAVNDFYGDTSMSSAGDCNLAQGLKWASIEEYKSETGKRFRMTKEQKARDISRDAAFIEFSAAAYAKENGNG